MQKVNLPEKLEKIKDHWHPRIAGELNGQHVKLAKLKGEFVWHKHEEEDEMFLILEGHLRVEFRDHSVELDKGEFIIVPKGIEHRPVAENECSVMLFEPAGAINTGDKKDELTRDELEWI